MHDRITAEELLKEWKRIRLEHYNRRMLGFVEEWGCDVRDWVLLADRVIAAIEADLDAERAAHEETPRWPLPDGHTITGVESTSVDESSDCLIYWKTRLTEPDGDETSDVWVAVGEWPYCATKGTGATPQAAIAAAAEAAAKEAEDADR